MLTRGILDVDDDAANDQVDVHACLERLQQPTSIMVEETVSKCSQGDAAACTAAAAMYERGHGVAVDIQKASDLHRKACDGGMEAACHDRTSIEGKP